MADSLKIKVNIDFNHFNSELSKLKSKVESTDIKIGTNNLNSSMKSISKNTKEAAKGFDLFNTSIVNAISKFSQWYLIGKLISGTFRLIVNGVNDIYLLDKAMTNISYTMDLTEQQFEDLKNKSFEFAESLNTSVHKVMEANQIFANLNETIESVNLKTETTIALANLTGASISEMTDVLQGLIFQFGLSAENAGDLGDALVSIAATTGVEFKRSILNMSQAVARAGSVAADAGFQYNEFLATIGTLNEQSRLAGSTLAAGLTTILSRLTRVSDASAEEISKVETALNKVGVRLRDGNGEFRDSFDVLYDLSKVYKQLTSVQQAELGFLIAGTRQRKVFNTLMESFPQIIKRSELALNSEGKIMELNDKKARSFEGAIDDLKNSLESLFDTIFKSDTFISIINFFTKLIDSTQQAIKNIDVLAASVTGLGTAIIGFKSAALATTGASATLAGAGTIGVLGLSAPVIFGITAAITTLTSAYVVYRKRVIEAKEVAAKFKEEQKVINDLIQNGNERELKIRINKLKELKQKYEEVKKAKKEFEQNNYEPVTGNRGRYVQYTMKLSQFKNKIKEIENELKKNGVTAETLDKVLYNLESRLSQVTNEFDNTGRTIRDLTQAYNNFQNALDNGLNNLKNINSVLQDVSENENFNKESVIELAKTYPQLLGVLNNRSELEQALIQIKNEQLEQTKLSLQREIEALERSLEAKAKIYGLEVQMIDTVNQTRLGFVRQKLSQVQGTIGLTRAQSQLEELYDTAKKVQDAKRFLNNFEVNVSNIGFKKSSKSTKDNLIQLSDTYLTFTENIEALNQQIEKNKLLLEDENLSNQDKIRILNEQQQKYKQLQSVLKALNSERVKERSKIKEQIKNLVEFNKAGEIIRYNQEKYTDKQANLIKQYQELGDAINQTKLEIVSLNNEIEQVNKEYLKDLKESYNKDYEEYLKDLKESYNKDYEEYKEKEQKKYEAFKEAREKEIAEIDEQLKELQRKYEDEEYVETQEDIDEQIRILEKERAMWSEDLSEESKRRQAEINEELLKLRQQKEKAARRREYELEKRKLKDKKDVINEEIRKEEEAMRKRIRIAEQTYDEAVENLERFEDKFVDVFDRIVDTIHSIPDEVGSTFDELEDIFNSVDGLDIPVKVAGYNLKDLTDLRDIKMRWEQATSQAEKDRLHQQANELRARMGINGDYWSLADLNKMIFDGIADSIADSIDGIDFNIPSYDPPINQQPSTGGGGYTGEGSSGGGSGGSSSGSRDDDPSRKTGEDGTPESNRNPRGSNSDYSEYVRQREGYDEDEWDEVERISIERGVDLGVAKDMHENNKRYGTEYHKGGFVGGIPFDPKHEEVAKLLKGELVLTPTHLDSLYNKISNIKFTNPVERAMNKIDKLLNIENFNMVNNVEGYDAKRVGRDLAKGANEQLLAFGMR